MSKRSIENLFWVRGMLALSLVGMLAVLTIVNASSPTVEQMQMFQQLTAEQKNQLRKSFENNVPATKVESFETPVVVEPFESANENKIQGIDRRAKSFPINRHEILTPFATIYLRAHPPRFRQ